MTEIINQAISYHKAGLGLHWLKPKSKKPIELNWTKSKKKNWDELKRSFRNDYNLGVRLGSFSALPGGKFLAVIDCDVKSGSDLHRREMLEKLKSLFRGVAFDAAPRVHSGRGNGSMHLYVATKKPAQPRRLAQASEMVKVLMPSSGEPSARDKKELSPEELSKGFRIRPAWEISMMGEGQQVVLPPSLHPDTGKKYTWGVEFEIENIPVIETPEKEKTEAVELKSFEPVEVDLLESNLSPRIIDLILSGRQSSGDKSADCFAATLAMLACGFSEDEILSVLTDRSHFLGEVAYRHAETSNRFRAALWLKRYTLKKAIAQRNEISDFDDEVEVSPLSVEEIRQTHQVQKDWQSEIERSSAKDGARPKNTMKNVQVILENACSPKLFSLNEFSFAETFGVDYNFGFGVQKAGSVIRDTHAVQIKSFLAAKFRFEPSNDRIFDAIHAIAKKNAFHPVQDYLDTLVWDEVPRVDNWLRTYLRAEGPKEYLQAVGRKTLCAMVARAYNPGTKYDYVLILEGAQGTGKSTSVRNLASSGWFTDATLSIMDKDSILTMMGAWVVELGELSGMKKADVDHLKEFISRNDDKIRVPYGRKTESFPRQCIFIGTTNNDEYLRDQSGNRRFWPVKVNDCDFEGIKRDRDQLFAEARFLFELGEPLFLEDKAVRQLACFEQQDREVYDPFQNVFDEFFQKHGDEKRWKEFNTTEVFEVGGPFEKFVASTGELRRAANILRKIGYQQIKKREGSKFIRIWAKK